MMENDKHTDAQGELTSADAINILRLALVNAECAIKGREHTGFITKALEATSRDWRATEGQAQTSAAGFDRKEFIRQVVLAVCEIPDRDSPEDQPEMMLVTDYELGSILESCFEYADERAAQLAGSTAPGAPRQEFNAERMTLLINRLSVANRRDGHTGAPEYGNADRKRAQNAVDVAERNLLQYVKSLAAPTAQQSLTAGGAVPDERALFEAEIRDIAPVNSGANKRFEDNGEYITVAMELMWKGWQARAAVNAKETAQ